MEFRILIKNPDPTSKYCTHIYISTFRGCFFCGFNLFSTKRYYRRYRIFSLIIVRLCSNLHCWIVHRLSFLEKKTELIYLHYIGLSTAVQVLCSIFWPKNVQKDVRTVKKPKLIFNLFPERKMILKKFKQI